MISGGIGPIQSQDNTWFTKVLFDGEKRLQAHGVNCEFIDLSADFDIIKAAANSSICRFRAELALHKVIGQNSGELIFHLQYHWAK
jgi:hypothetical protein